jgi:hypothetical protein
MRAMRPTLALLAALLGTASSAAAEPLQPLVVEWAQFFTVESRPAGGGTLWNTSGWGARRIQLLVETLDGAGRPIEQRVVWLGSDLSAGSRIDFETPVPASAPYRVRVFAFSLDATAGPR